MILYRGTPEPEVIPRARRYAAAFFSPNLEYAAEYGEWIQKYNVGKQKILKFGGRASRTIVYEFTGELPDRDHNDESEMDLFWHPTKEWKKFVESYGYTGTAFGWDVCIFDLSRLKLIERRHVERVGREFKAVLVP